jgi:hypothetical protein
MTKGVTRQGGVGKQIRPRSERLIVQIMACSNHSGAVYFASFVLARGIASAGSREEVRYDPLGCFPGCFFWKGTWSDMQVSRVFSGTYIPGVLINRLCGMWNCIVLGGLAPNSSLVRSFRSSSLSHMADLLIGFFPGVRTLMPGFGVMRLLLLSWLLRAVPGPPVLTGDRKISSCSFGASISGLEIGESSNTYFEEDWVLGVAMLNLVRPYPLDNGVACTR